jgi:hypothetical protein
MVQTKWGPRTASSLVAGRTWQPADPFGPGAPRVGCPYALFSLTFLRRVPELDAGPSYLHWGRSAFSVRT